MVSKGRQLVELLCFSGDLPLTDIFSYNVYLLGNKLMMMMMMMKHLTRSQVARKLLVNVLEMLQCSDVVTTY